MDIDHQHITLTTRFVNGIDKSRFVISRKYARRCTFYIPAGNRKHTGCCKEPILFPIYFYNLDFLCTLNTVSCSEPIAVCDMLHAHGSASMRHVMLMGFGVGLSWAGCIVNLTRVNIYSGGTDSNRANQAEAVGVRLAA